MKGKKLCQVSVHTGDSARSYSTIAKWTSESKFGWESLDDVLHSGCPKSATTPEFIT
jgi:hypothetical protein